MTDKVAIVGADLVDRAWGYQLRTRWSSRKCFSTPMTKRSRAHSTLESMLRTLELRGMLKGQTAAEVHSRMTGAGSLEIALAGAAHVSLPANRAVSSRIRSILLTSFPRSNSRLDCRSRPRGLGVTIQRLL
jgi:hypothetical protein